MDLATFLAVPATVGGVAVAGAVSALMRRQHSTGEAVLAGVGAGALFALGWCLTSWIALGGLILGIVVYGLARMRLTGDRALVAAACLYVLFTLGAGTMLYIGLANMG